MLSLVTGLPGHGKTLWTLQHVEKLRESTGRKVYYSGVPELTLPWEELPDPTKWHELPDGAVFVLDEAQTVFRERSRASAVPAYVSAFETHRHRGHDVFLITQDAKLVDPHVRKLVGAHFHIQRLYGTHRARVYEWQKVNDPSKRADLALAQKSVTKYNEKAFSWYKSATVHTVQRRLPWKWIAFIAFAFLVMPPVAYFGLKHFKVGVEKTVQGKAGQVEGQPGVSSAAVGSERFRPQALVPRLESWPWSSAFYDSVAVPVARPRIVGCMKTVYASGRTECRCSNGQGDAGVSQHLCLQYIGGTYFDPTVPTQDVKAQNIALLNARDAGGAGGGLQNTSGSGGSVGFTKGGS